MKIAEIINRIEEAKKDLTTVQDQLTRAEFRSAFRGLETVKINLHDLHDEAAVAYGLAGLVR